MYARLATLGICGILLCALAGCARGTPVPTATASPIAPKQLPLIGVSLPDVDSTTTTLIQKGLSDNERKSDVALIYRSADGKAEKQTDDIGDLVRLAIVGLIVYPVDAVAIAPAVEQARAKGIPVIALVTPPAGVPIDMLVRTDDRANGREAAKSVTEKVAASGATLILTANDATGADFSAGAAEALAKIPAAFQTAAATDAQSVPGIVLPAVREQNVRTILASTDTLVLAVRDTLRGAGLLDMVAVIGYGGTRDATRAVLDGTLAGDVDTRPQDLGVAAVGDIAALVRKKQPASDVTIQIGGIDIRVDSVAGRLITRDNARDMQERWPDLVYAPAPTPTSAPKR
jgi:ABC-type sugar transport system substrate-binding protein